MLNLVPINSQNVFSSSIHRTKLNMAIGLVVHTSYIVPDCIVGPTFRVGTKNVPTLLGCWSGRPAKELIRIYRGHFWSTNGP